MAKRSPTSAPAESSSSKTVTAERATRLYRLLMILNDGPQTRQDLMRKLRLDVRGFYRDLETLRSAGIRVPVSGGRYTLAEKLAVATVRLPFPDPHFSLGDAMALAKGRTKAHRKLRDQIDKIVQ